MPARNRKFRDSVYEQFARVGKAVSAPKRLELLELLCHGPRTVETLAGQAALSVANASRHLQVLRGAGLVESEKRGLYVEYRVADEQVSRFYLALRSLAESRLAGIEKVTREFFEERDGLEAIPGEELIRRVKCGEVTILDVRPAEEYRAGHIPGAISMPVAEIKARLDELPKGRDVIAYCRGPYCVMAAEAVDVLRKKGVRAHRLEQGVLEWRARGWRVDASVGSPGDTRRAGQRP